MIFDSYEMKRYADGVHLYAEMVVQFDNMMNEDFEMGTPKWWDDKIFSEIDIVNYDIYYLCFKLVPYGEYNCVTDYKKVWGLNNIIKGDYDNTYFNDYGKVYFGIIKAKEKEDFCSPISSTVLFLKKDMPITYDDLFNIIEEMKYDFNNVEWNDDLYNKIRNKWSSAVLLRYSHCCGSGLRVYGVDGKSFLKNLNLQEYNYKDVEVTCKNA